MGSKESRIGRPSGATGTRGGGGTKGVKLIDTRGCLKRKSKPGEKVPGGGARVRLLNEGTLANWPGQKKKARGVPCCMGGEAS